MIETLHLIVENDVGKQNGIIGEQSALAGSASSAHGMDALLFINGD